MPRGTRYLPRAKSGVDIREVTKCRRGPSPDKDPEYAGYGFADVRRACHRWLMSRDEIYRKNYDARQEGTASPTTTHRGF
jgi:hypothetical protein